jgi:hypothetical protein
MSALSWCGLVRRTVHDQHRNGDLAQSGPVVRVEDRAPHSGGRHRRGGQAPLYPVVEQRGRDVVAKVRAEETCVRSAASDTATRATRFLPVARYARNLLT